MGWQQFSTSSTGDRFWTSSISLSPAGHTGQHLGFFSSVTDANAWNYCYSAIGNEIPIKFRLSLRTQLKILNLLPPLLRNLHDAFLIKAGCSIPLRLRKPGPYPTKRLNVAFSEFANINAIQEVNFRFQNSLILVCSILRSH